MREQRKRAEDANRICSIINENVENKGLGLAEAEMGETHASGRASAWEGWHWDDNKGGWLDQELCSKARRGGVRPSTQDVRESSQRGVLTRNWKGPH